MAERSYNGRNIYTRQIDSLVTGDVATTVSGNMESSNNSGWYLIVGATAASAEFDSSEKRTGAYTLKLSTLDALGRCSCFYGDMPGLTIPVKPNSTYTVKIYAKTNNAATAAVYLGATEYSSRGGIFLRNTNTNNLSGTNDWTLLEATFTTHPRTTTLFLYCQIAVAGNISDAWFDVNSLQLLEVLPARTTATSRTTATNRVAVRDMGTALRFDGSTNKILATGINLSGGSTFSAMFMATKNSGVIIGNSSDATDRRVLAINANGLLVAGVYNSSLWSSYVSSTTKIVLNKWYHVVVSIAPSIAGGTAVMYLNGVLQTGTTFPGAQASSNIFLSVGSRTSSAGDFFGGVIDNVRVFDQQLTASEMLNMYHYGIIPTPKLEYLFDEGAGTTALDTSGNGNHGTITGATYTLEVPLEPRASI